MNSASNAIRAIACSLLFPLGVALGADTVLHVRIGAPPGGNGLSWESAFTEIAPAVSAAALLPGTVEIWVARGDYETGAEPTTGFSLLGGFAGTESSSEDRDPELNPTAIAFVNIFGPSDPVYVDGLSLRSSGTILNATITFRNCTFRSITGGDALYVGSSAIRLENCLIADNAYRALELYHCPSVEIVNCTFLNNFSPDTSTGAVTCGDCDSIQIDSCRFEANASAGPAGALLLRHSNPVLITNSVFALNSGRSGGAISVQYSNLVCTRSTFNANYSVADGGAISLDNSDIIVQSCHFEENTSQGGVGGGLGTYYSRVTLVNSSFWRNAAVSGGGVAITGSGNETRITGCVFAENFAVISAGAATIYGILDIGNCTVANNMASVRVGGLLLSGGSIRMNNSIVHGNSAPSSAAASDKNLVVIGAIASIHSNLIGGDSDFGDPSNLTGNPLFESSATLQLSASSPCIDAGDGCAMPFDEFDIDGDGDLLEVLPLDAASAPRIVDNETVADRGIGYPPFVDMGAFEFQVGRGFCIGDFDRDHVVGLGDLGIVFGGWGTSLGDTDCSGSTDLIDLGNLLSHWGNCHN